MNVKEYLEEVSKTQPYANVTFIIVRAEKDDYSPLYHEEYETTPIRTVDEWLQFNSKTLDLLVINKDHSPIDITGMWCNQYKRGHLKCCIVADENYLTSKYSETQAKDMKAFYEREVK